MIGMRAIINIINERSMKACLSLWNDTAISLRDELFVLITCTLNQLLQISMLSLELFGQDLMIAPLHRHLR